VGFLVRRMPGRRADEISIGIEICVEILAAYLVETDVQFGVGKRRIGRPRSADGRSIAR
jgi:hypothetical protein